MKYQYVKIYSWMTELGLTAEELIVFAVISAYSEFKGAFDGSVHWMSQWIGTAPSHVNEVLDSLIRKNCIKRGRTSFGTDAYCSCIFGGNTNPRTRERSIDTIDTIDNKNKNKNNIDTIGTIGTIGTIDTIDTIDIMKDPSEGTIGTIGSIGRTEAAGPADKPAKPERPSKRHPTPEELSALIAPYANVYDVPLQELAKRLSEWEAAQERKEKAMGAAD